MQHPKPQHTTWVRVGRITMGKATAIDMMAQEIARRGLEGCVREVDLVKLGFTVKQIAAWAPEAYKKAVTDTPGLIDALAA
jgi:regulator of RNase E activity RraA